MEAQTTQLTNWRIFQMSQIHANTHAWLEKDKFTADTINKQGNIIPKMAYLPYIPENGCYTYKTCPQMTGSWIISGAIKVIRELSNEEVARICHEHGYEPLPTWKETAKNIS